MLCGMVHDDRYDRGDDYLEVLYKLLEASWDDDAVVRDPERGVYTEPDRVHLINHVGPYYQVPGPHLSEPSPQRTPVLFQADLDSAAASLSKSEADIVKAKADAALAKVQYDRELDAFNKGGGSASNKDEKEATYAVTKAQLKVAESTKLTAIAAEAKAKKNLDYCTILAPTSGVARFSKVNKGDAVAAYQTLMVEVIPTDPVYATWEIDENTSLWYREQIYEKKTISDPKVTRMEVTIAQKDETAFKRSGAVTFIDTDIVRGTGTRTLRAEFANADNLFDHVLTFEDTPNEGPVDVERAPGRGVVDLAHRLMQEGARGRQARLKDRHLAMDGLVVGHGRRRGAAVPALGHRHVGVEHAPGDADGDAAEAAGIEQCRADGIERARLGSLVVDVARRRVRIGHEQVLDRVAVAAGAA